MHFDKPLEPPPEFSLGNDLHIDLVGNAGERAPDFCGYKEKNKAQGKDVVTLDSRSLTRNLNTKE